MSICSIYKFLKLQSCQWMPASWSTSSFSKWSNISDSKSALMLPKSPCLLVHICILFDSANSSSSILQTSTQISIYSRPFFFFELTLHVCNCQLPLPWSHHQPWSYHQISQQGGDHCQALLTIFFLHLNQMQKNVPMQLVHLQFLIETSKLEHNVLREHTVNLVKIKYEVKS